MIEERQIFLTAHPFIWHLAQVSGLVLLGDQCLLIRWLHITVIQLVAKLIETTLLLCVPKDEIFSNSVVLQIKRLTLIKSLQTCLIEIKSFRSRAMSIDVLVCRETLREGEVFPLIHQKVILHLSDSLKPIRWITCLGPEAIMAALEVANLVRATHVLVKYRLIFSESSVLEGIWHVYHETLATELARICVELASSNVVQLLAIVL